MIRYRFGEDQDSAENPSDDKTPAWLEALFGLFDSQRFAALATLIETLLWGVMIAAVGLLIWHYRNGLQVLVSRGSVRGKKTLRPMPPQAFGLDLSRETLPADIAASAENLWQSHPREALGLLYRALLSHLLHDFGIALKAADTEGQVLGGSSDFNNRHCWPTAET